MKYIISGGNELKGEIKVAGAKNAILPILAASLLTNEPCHINNIPMLRDVGMMRKVLEHLGVTYKETSVTSALINSSKIDSISVSEELMRLLRA
ncbi:MAG: UDP-N-acetylglucosamine 1-carboxyvinyltransferase, partial [Bacillota bacterium]|nr:UDP-N-acetylglucosamine 1-carboxyvinyltransferase [Bacillota bacterium]